MSDVALVCGGAGALGRAVSLELARTASVVVADVNADASQDVAQQIQHAGGHAVGVACDLTSSARVDELVQHISDTSGPISILVNLAGAVRNAPLHRLSDEDFTLVQDSHVRTTLNTMRACTPGMRSRGHGRVVNTSSIAALGSRGATAYSAAKGAIESMTRTVALELADHGVTVNCVAPGVIDSGLFLQSTQDFRDLVVGRVPIGRPARPEEVAAAYTFLCSDPASYITGQVLSVCGGLTVGALD